MSFLSGNSGQESITVGGVTIALSRVKILTCRASTAKYDSFRENGSIYQVPVGKTFYCLALKIFNSTGTVSSGTFYTSTASVSDGVAPSGNTLVDVGGAQDGALNVEATTANQREIATFFSVSAGRYLNMYADNGSMNCLIIGYEE